jgi:TatD DNase family protein
VLIDTHCHLDQSNCAEGADGVLDRARAAGVGAFVAIGVGSLAAAREVLALAARRADVVCTAGVHPHEAGTADEATVAELSRLASEPAVVAVGEIGLDYHYDHSPRDVQGAVFRRLIAVARAVRKPIVVHTRSAPADTLDVLAEEGARDVGGVIHCFSEDRAFASRALDLGFDLSFSGIVTFKSALAVQDVAAWAPEDRILVETDSPYLAPVPKRGRPNEPAYVVHTARRMAELRGVSVAEIARITTENACRRFGPLLDAAVRSGQS